MKFETMLKAIHNPLIKKSFKVLILRTVGVFFLFFVTLYITNNFQVSIVGQYDVSRAILFIVGSVCLLGINQSIIYYSGYLQAHNALSSIKQIYRIMIAIVLTTSLLIFLFLLLIPKNAINFFYEKDVYDIVFKTFSILFFYGITLLNIEFYRAINKIGFSEIFRNILRHVFFLIAIIIIDSIGRQDALVDVFLLNFILLSVGSTMAVFYSLKKIKKSRNKINIGFKEIISRSYPMSISFICFLLMQSTDIILLGKFMSFKDVAHYAVAVKLTTIIALVLTSVNAVYAPKIAELFNLNKSKELKENIKKATRLIFLLTTPIILFMLFFSSSILPLFGKGYINASVALKILLVSQIINALSGSVGMYMNMTGNEKIFQRILLIALIVNVVLNWILIPKYYLLGAAVATSISTIFWNIYSVWYLYKKKQIKTFLH